MRAVFQLPASMTSVVDAPRAVSSDASPTRPLCAVTWLALAYLWDRSAVNGHWVRATRPRLARDSGGRLVDATGAVILDRRGAPVTKWKDKRAVLLDAEGRPVPVAGEAAREHNPAAARLHPWLTEADIVALGYPPERGLSLEASRKRKRRSLPFPSTGRPRLLPTSFAKHQCSGRGTSQVSRLPYISQIVPAAPLAPETVRRRDRKVRPLYVEPADAGDYQLFLQFAGIEISQSLIAVNEQVICVYADSKL